MRCVVTTIVLSLAMWLAIFLFVIVLGHIL
jgi:hypothetical protein